MFATRIQKEIVGRNNNVSLQSAFFSINNVAVVFSRRTHDGLSNEIRSHAHVGVTIHRCYCYLATTITSEILQAARYSIRHCPLRARNPSLCQADDTPLLKKVLAGES